MTQQPVAVVAVVVTWNRRDLLAESLRAVLGQTRPPDRVLVVDNASDDGTAALLTAEFAQLEVLRTSKNLGGAGGFAVGVREAVADSTCDLVWLLDDDTVPTPGALAALVAAWSTYPEARPALLASRVEWTDGREHPMNTPRVRPRASQTDKARAASCGCLPIRSASFVSMLVAAEQVRARGLPIADYFIWNDDFEFSTRLARGSVALFCPASVVVHKTATFGSTDSDPGARFFYEVRNKTWLFTRSRCLSVEEKLLYGGATLVRWCRTVARSSHRRVVLAALARGLWRGVSSAPRPTTAVIGAEPASRRRGGRDG